MSEKILIIDDEQDIADLLEVYLKNENYVVYKFYCATDVQNSPNSLEILRNVLMYPFIQRRATCDHKR